MFSDCFINPKYYFDSSTPVKENKRNQENIFLGKKNDTLYPHRIPNIRRRPLCTNNYACREDHMEKLAANSPHTSVHSSCSSIQNMRKHDTSDLIKLDSYNAISGTLNSVKSDLLSEGRVTPNYKEAFFRTCSTKDEESITRSMSNIFGSDDQQNEQMSQNDGYIGGPLNIDPHYSSTRNDVDLELSPYNSSDDEDVRPEQMISSKNKVDEWLLKSPRCGSSSASLSQEGEIERPWTPPMVHICMEPVTTHPYILEGIDGTMGSGSGVNVNFEYPYTKVKSATGRSSVAKKSSHPGSFLNDPNRSLIRENMLQIYQENVQLRDMLAYMQNDADASQIKQQMEHNERRVIDMVHQLESVVSDLSNQNDTLERDKSRLKDLVCDQVEMSAYVYRRIPNERQRR